MERSHPPPRSARSDESLVDAARNGDSTAVEQLLRDNYERIYTLCRRMCRNREQAEDATQNALIAIVRGLPGFDGRSKFSTWCYRVATNSTLDELRRGSRHDMVSLDRDFGSDGPGSIDPTRTSERDLPGTPGSGHSTDPIDSVLASETRKELAQALESLDERFRVPLVLREVADLDYSEIGELLDLAPGTVRSRISRARRHLGEILAGSGLDARGPSSEAVAHRSPIGNQTGSEIVKPDER